jgi:glyoxylase-like metal-dependent hydrolase (beta-lactamase superfamily II)
MEIKNFVFNPFRENTYVVWDSSGECIFIDAGCHTDREQERVAQLVAEQQLTPVAVVTTHGHVDHIAGNAFLCSRYGIDSYLHKDDFAMLGGVAAWAAQYEFGLQAPPTPKVMGSSVAFGHTQLQVLHTPGHSRGSVSLYEKEQGVVFTGDTLFKGTIGRSDLDGSDLNALMDSLHLVLLNLPDETTVLPGHGFSTSIGSERWHNPFLQPSDTNG